MNNFPELSKHEIIQRLREYLQNPLLGAETPADRYLTHLVFYAISFERRTVKSFIILYLQLLEEYQMPFCNIEEVKRVYRIYKDCPKFLHNIDFFHKKLKAFRDYFWDHLYFFASYNNNHTSFDLTLSCIEYYLNWLEKKLKLKAFHSYQFKKIGLSLIVRFIDYKFNALNSFKRTLSKKGNSPFHITCLNLKYHLRKGGELKDFNFYYNDFIISYLEKHPHLYDEVLALQEKLPLYYLKAFGNNVLTNLIYLNQKRPSIFDDLLTNEDEPETFNTLLNLIASKFKLSPYLWDKFKRGLLNNTTRGWFEHLLSGKNLVSAPNLPFPLTKRMAHFFQILEPIERLSEENFLFIVLFILRHWIGIIAKLL